MIHTLKLVRACAALAAGTLLLVGAARPAAAQTVSTVFSLPTSLQGAQAGVIDGGDGYLYGTAYATNSIYKVKPDGTGFAIIHTFAAGTGSNYPDGQYPRRELVLGSDGTLYGTASNGGANGNGTIFRVSRDGSAFSVLYSFSAEDGSFHNADGANPFGGLALGSDGALYGTTQYGGASGRGTAFKFGTDGSDFTPLHQFSAAGSSDSDTNGSLPVAGLVNGGDGYFYGTTSFGGANGYGTVYQLSADGTVFTLIHSFTSTEGSSQAALVRASDGRFYGTCFQGGTTLKGLLFGLAADGSGFQVLHTFTAYDNQGHNADGSAPVGALAQGPDGALYGATQNGGAYSHGGAYRVTTDGTFQPLASFGAASTDPNGPTGTLVRVGSTLYGTSPYGGGNGFGSIFAIAGFASAPAAPTGLVVAASGSTVSLTWSLADSTATSVLLERQTSGGAWAQIASLPAGTTASQNTGLTLGTTYGYRVRAANASGFSPYSNTVSVTLAAAPVPGRTHILWINTGGSVWVWNYSPTAGSQSNYSPSYTYSYSYGSFPGWTTKAIADGGTDSQTRLLWTKTSGLTSLWSLDTTTGKYTFHDIGPYTGWTANAMSVGTDNTTHILWNNIDGTASVWNYSTATGSQTNHNYGPFPGWTAKAVADGPDGKIRLLWTNTDGRMSVWSVDNVSGQFTSHDFGPYTGWTAKAVSVGIDNTTHIVWNKSDGTVSVWNYSTDSGGFTQNAYGPYAGWSAVSVADTADGKTALLWSNVNGMASAWNLDNSTGSFTQNTFGPYSGWSAVGISAAH